MSVMTTADAKIKSAKEKIGDAIKLLMEALDDSTWGIEDLKDTYVDTLYECIAELAKIKRRL